MDNIHNPLTTVAARLMAEAETESGEADEVMGRYARKFRSYLLALDTGYGNISHLAGYANITGR